MPHSISATKEIGRIGWYLGEVVLHEHAMPERAILMDAKSADLRPLSFGLLLVF
jgi:hypothetical protein